MMMAVAAMIEAGRARIFVDREQLGDWQRKMETAEETEAFGVVWLTTGWAAISPLGCDYTTYEVKLAQVSLRR